MASKNPKGLHNTTIWRGATPFVGSALLSILLAPYLAQAQTKVVADTSVSANAPGVKTTSDSKTYVNIVKANEQGLSHNKYSTFNVGTEGVILNNNAGTAAVNPKLSTQNIAANPNLNAGKPASTILNEVTSTNASTLAGKIEIAGTRANLIVANPNGIACDGCGVINGANAVLAASAVAIKDGSVSTFDGIGTVTVGEDGLDAVDLTKSLWLYGKNISVNGKVVAGDSTNGQDINAIATAMTIPAFQADRALLPTGVGTDINATRLAVWAKGSMYGKNIRLYSLDLGGNISITGVVDAKADLKADSNGRILVGSGKDELTLKFAGGTNLREALSADPELRGKMIQAAAASSSGLTDKEFLHLLMGEKNGNFLVLQNLTEYDGKALATDSSKYKYFRMEYVKTDGGLGPIDAVLIYNATDSKGTKDSVQIGSLDGKFSLLETYIPALRKAIAANGIAALTDAVGTAPQYDGDSTYKVSLVRARGTTTNDNITKAVLTNSAVYAAFAADLRMDQNHFAWKVLDKETLPVNATKLVASGGVDMDSVFTTQAKGARIESLNGSVAINAGYIGMTDADIKAKNHVTIYGKTGVALDELDQRVYLELDNAVGGKQVYDNVTKKYGDRGVRVEAGWDASIESGKNLTVTAGYIAAGGNVSLKAGGDNLTIQNGMTGITSKDFFDGGSNDEKYEYYDEDINPTFIKSGKSVLIDSHGNGADGKTYMGKVNIASSIVNAGGLGSPSDANFVLDDSSLTIKGRGFVQLVSAVENDTYYAYEYHKKSTLFGLGSKSTTSIIQYTGDYDLVDSLANGGVNDLRYATQLVGRNIAISSKNDDVKLKGAYTLSEAGTQLTAHNVLLDAPTYNVSANKTYIVERKGIIAEDFFKSWSVFVGTDKLSVKSDDKWVLRGANTVDARGDLDVVASKNVALSGSNLRSASDIHVTGANVVLDAAMGSYEHTQKETYKSVGLEVGFQGAVFNSLTKTASLLDKAEVAGDKKLKSIYELNAGVAALAALEDLEDVGASYTNGNTSKGVLDEFNDGKGVGLGVSFGVTMRKKENKSFELTGLASSIATYDASLKKNDGETDTELAIRQVKGGTGSVVIKANGAKADGHGNINSVGALITAQNIELASNGDTKLTSFEAGRWAKEKTESIDASVGVAAYASLDGNLGIFASAGGAYSTSGTGSTEWHNIESQVKARGTLTLKSSGSLQLEGAQASGETVKAAVKEHLTLRSQRDESTYERQSFNAKGSVSFPVYGVALETAVSAGFSAADVDAKHRAVQDKSFIAAGAGGFDIDVDGTTTLVGAQIASAAVPDKNRLVTNKLSHSAITNDSKLDMQTEGYSISISGQFTDPGKIYKDAVKWKGWDAIKAEVTADLVTSAAQGILKNINFGVDTSVAANTTSKVNAAVAPGTLTVATGGGDAGLSRVASTGPELLANIWDQKSAYWGVRQDYASAVYSTALDSVNLFAEKMTEAAKTSQVNAYNGLSDAEKKALKVTDSSGKTVSLYDKYDATGTKATASDVQAAFKAYSGSDAEIKAAQAVVSSKNTELAVWNKSTSSPGAAVAALRGGLEVMKATMSNDKVSAGGSGLILSQVLYAVSDYLAKDKPIYGNIFASIVGDAAVKEK